MKKRRNLRSLDFISPMCQSRLFIFRNNNKTIGCITPWMFLHILSKLLTHRKMIIFHFGELLRQLEVCIEDVEARPQDRLQALVNLVGSTHTDGQEGPDPHSAQDPLQTCRPGPGAGPASPRRRRILISFDNFSKYTSWDYKFSVIEKLPGVTTAC